MLETLSGYPEPMKEKVLRLSDILYRIGKSPLLVERLSLYGGTALNFLYLDLPRLSEDLDFNYRHIYDQDWGEVRERIDEEIKWILLGLKYPEDSIKISPQYNHCRFIIRYLSGTCIKDQLTIEIGYMRRTPDLKDDTLMIFVHPETGMNIQIMTPKKEELFANKFCTMISRSKRLVNPRDVFDVYSISQQTFTVKLFIELVIIGSLLMDLDILEFNPNTLQKEKKKFAPSMRRLIAGKIDTDHIITSVEPFLFEVQRRLKEYPYQEIKETFFSSGILDLSQFHYKNEFNEALATHPQLLWLKKKKPR